MTERSARRRAAALALAAGLAACGGEPPPEAEAPAVVVQPVVAVDLEERIEATGALVARSRALVAAEVGGRVTSIVRDEGSAVGEGEVVLLIDPERRQLERDDARARLAEASAAAAEAGRESERIAALHAKGVASQARRDQAATEQRLAHSRRDAAQAQLDMAERALRDANVCAPFTGVVAARKVSAGEFVQPGSPLFELVAMDPIEAEFHLPEADASRVRVGQEVAVRVAPWPERVFPAAVSFVSPTIDPQTHTLLVRAALANPEHLLRPGLFARVDLGVSRRPGVAMIPEEAVLQRADGEVVFRLGREERVERLVIATGAHHEGLVEVKEGLRPGDRIVVQGHYGLVHGGRVEPRSPEGELAERREGAQVATP